jgi:acyl carrier protein
MIYQSRNELVQQVIDLIFRSLNLKHLDRAQVTEATPLMKEGLNLDSVDILEIVVNVESQYGFKVRDAETGATYFRTIGTVADLIEKQRAVAKPAPAL